MVVVQQPHKIASKKLHTYTISNTHHKNQVDLRQFEHRNHRKGKERGREKKKRFASKSRMTGVEFIPFICVPVAAAMFAQSDRHASAPRAARQHNQRRRRQGGWAQTQQAPSNQARRMVAATSPPRSPPPVEQASRNSIEVTLEEFRL